MKTPKAKYLDRIMVPFHCSTLFQNHSEKANFWLRAIDKLLLASIFSGIVFPNQHPKLSMNLAYPTILVTLVT
jgi:hypothetical protein